MEFIISFFAIERLIMIFFHFANKRIVETKFYLTLNKKVFTLENNAID